MPLTLLVVGAAVLVGWLRGGRLRRLAHAELRSNWLLGLGVALQVLVDLGASRGWLVGTAAYTALMASQVLVLGWVWRNRYRPGMGLIALGLLCNAVVIGANGAMPVDLDAIRAVGVEAPTIAPGEHEPMDASTRLPWLADRLPLPPLRTIVSVGDILLAAGLLPLVHHLMTYRPPAERRRSRARVADTEEGAG